jgi:hypothetical protein
MLSNVLNRTVVPLSIMGLQICMRWLVAPLVRLDELIDKPASTYESTYCRQPRYHRASDVALNVVRMYASGAENNKLPGLNSA